MTHFKKQIEQIEDLCDTRENCRDIYRRKEGSRRMQYGSNKLEGERIKALGKRKTGKAAGVGMLQTEFFRYYNDRGP